MRQGLREGLGALLVPGDQGGAGLPLTLAVEVFATLAAADFAFTFALVTHNNTVRAIARAGRLEPGLIDGSLIAAFCLTEPEAGSDAAAITCQATRTADGWRLDGEKAWVTNGAAADVFMVYAQTDAGHGHRGIASFLVRAGNPGLGRGEPYGLLGGHALGTTSITLRSCDVPEDGVLAAPGAGFKAAMAGIDTARVDVAAMCCGMLGDSLAAALDRVRSRRAFGRPLADFQGLQFELVDVAVNLDAARQLVAAAAAAIDAGAEDAPILAAKAKKLATAAALPGIAACMQAMGAEGLKEEHRLGRHLAAAKIAQYLDGATEIQNVVIARSLGLR